MGLLCAGCWVARLQPPWLPGCAQPDDGPVSGPCGQCQALNETPAPGRRTTPVVNSDHVSLRPPRVTLDNPVYLRNAMVDLLIRRSVEKEEISLSTSTEVAEVEQAELVPYA